MNRKHGLTGAVAATIVMLQAGVAWGVVPSGKRISGTVTTPPTSSRIEVEHQPYKIDPNSQAAQTVSQIHSGDQVDVVLDLATSSVVVSISRQPH